MVDVGGVALLAAAARNCAAVAVASSPLHYPRLLRELQELVDRLGRAPPGPRRGGVRRRSPRTTPRSRPFSTSSSGNLFPARLALVLEKVEDLRYGENPHQRAAFYRETTHRSGTLADASQLHGAPPSFNNLLDLDAAYRIARDFTSPTVAIVKHTDPVGLASNDEPRRGLPQGARVRLGRRVRRHRRGQSADGRRDRARNRRELVRGRGRAVVQRCGARDPPPEGEPRDPGRAARPHRGPARLRHRDARLPAVAGGLLVQTQDELGLDRGQLQVVTQRRPTLEELTDLLFAWRAVRHVRSNAIVLAKNARHDRDRCGPGEPHGLGRDRASPGRRPCQARRPGDRRVLPVPGRDRAGGECRGHRDHPARRVHSRRDGDRGRRPPSPGDGLHGPPPLPKLANALSGAQPKSSADVISRRPAKACTRGAAQ